jgi:hypothetical protein
VIAAYSSRMTEDYPGYDQQRAAQRYDTLNKLRDAAKKTLTTADWVDQAKGTVRIPIEEAMTVEVDTLKGQPAAVGSEIPAAAPPAPAKPAPAAGGTNAAPAKPSAPAAKTASTNAAPSAATPPPAKPNPSNK